MRGPWIPVNLSAEPFKKDRTVLVASVLTAVLLVAVLISQIAVIKRERHAARENRGTLVQLDTQLQALNRDYGRISAQLRQPVSTAVFDRSVFLNQLLQRKGISWTRLFSDLEAVFPSAVRLVAVRPNLTADHDVQLDMVVGSASPEPVIDLIRKLESSHVFGATALLSSQPPSQNEPIYRYRLSVSYAQKL
jgi:type IV pilus assembly protein PilN